MKTRKKPIVLLAVTALVFSCANQQEEEKESVQVSGLPESLAFAAIPAEGASFTIESNVAWSISKTGLDWLTLDPMRGNAAHGVQTVTITAAENKDEAARSGSFTLRAGSYEKTVQASQSGATVIPTFTLSGAEGNLLSFKAEETGSKSFSVASNKDWTASLSGLDWAEVSPLEGKKDRSATITVTPKSANGGSAREGTISFAYGADAPVVVRVNQGGFEPEISLSVRDLLVAADGSADISSVTVTANSDWTASSGAAWISLDKTAGPAGATVVSLRFAVNEKTEDRSAAVTFDNHGVKAELTVRQVAKPSETLSVSPESLAFGKTGETRTLQIESNAAWTVSASESWLSVSPASGNGNGSVSVTAGANAGGERTATVTVSVTETLRQTVTVTQEAGVSEDAFIDLTTPLEWISDSQTFNMQRSPAYPSAGQTGARTDGGPMGSGIVFPNREDDIAYAQHILGENAFTGTYTPLFIFATEGHITWKPSWNDDAMVFFIPVKSIAAGQTLYFDFAIRGTSACPRYWAAEVNINGTWEPFDTGFSEEVKDGDTDLGIANGKLTGNGVVSSYRGTYTVKTAVSHATIMARIRCVFAGIGANGKSYSGVQPNGTLRLPNGDIDGASFRGPTFYIK